MISAHDLRAKAAALLGVDAAALRDDVPLTDQGLDSIRAMALIDALRAAGGAVSFADLAERPTIRDWS